MIITIDGPVASGKSTIAKKLAEELGMYYLYTGLLYRAVAYILINDIYKDEDLCKYVSALTSDRLGFITNLCYDYGQNTSESRPYLFYKGKDITKKLYDASLDQPASIVSANKNVRESLLGFQRDIAKKYDIIADGRDCGSVVFPDADYKFYLTADSYVRAERVMMDEKRGAFEKDLNKVKAELEERDKRDSERDVAPLKIPEGAIIIDNSKLTFQNTVNKFLSFIKVQPQA